MHLEYAKQLLGSSQNEPTEHAVKCAPPASYQPPASEAPFGALSARAESPLQEMRLSAGSLPERCASKKRYELSRTCMHSLNQLVHACWVVDTRIGSCR